MAFTITAPALAGPFGTADDYDGKEGYAAKISGAAGSETVTLAVVADTAALLTAVGVIVSIAGSDADGNQVATVQMGGPCYAYAGAAFAAGAVVSPNASGEWIATDTTGTDYVKGLALQGSSAAGDIVQIQILGLTAADAS
jgi:hypothetical protein